MLKRYRRIFPVFGSEEDDVWQPPWLPEVGEHGWAAVSKLEARMEEDGLKRRRGRGRARAGTETSKTVVGGEDRVATGHSGGESGCRPSTGGVSPIVSPDRVEFPAAAGGSSGSHATTPNPVTSSTSMTGAPLPDSTRRSGEPMPLPVDDSVTAGAKSRLARGDYRRLLEEHRAEYDHLLSGAATLLHEEISG